MLVKLFSAACPVFMRAFTLLVRFNSRSSVKYAFILSMKYYILTGAYPDTSKTELIFGDYERETVEYEKDYTEDYRRLKIHALSSDTQAAIDAKLEQLNRGNPDYKWLQR